jgi:hypothetical protein
MASCPLAFGYGWHAFVRAPDRWWACAALAVSGLELIVWCLMVVSLGAGLVGSACALALGLAYLVRHC